MKLKFRVFAWDNDDGIVPMLLQKALDEVATNGKVPRINHFPAFCAGRRAFLLTSEEVTAEQVEEMFNKKLVQKAFSATQELEF